MGLPGVRLDEKRYGRESHVIEFFPVGTAVVPTEDEWGKDVLSAPVDHGLERCAPGQDLVSAD
jgi:hypothetical protein